MVDIGKIPSEGEVYDIADLPAELTLIATGEKYKEQEKGSIGGLVIYYADKDKKTVAQKYGKVAGYALQKAMKALGLKDTAELQEGYYKYKLTFMRSGYPRLLPIARAGKA